MFWGSWAREAQKSCYMLEYGVRGRRGYIVHSKMTINQTELALSLDKC